MIDKYAIEKNIKFGEKIYKIEYTLTWAIITHYFKKR